MDIDAFNTSLVGRLASIVMLPDTPVKAAWLEAFSRWVDNGYKVTEGTGPASRATARSSTTGVTTRPMPWTGSAAGP